MVKMYEVTFLEYTNPTKNSVKSKNGKFYDIMDPTIISENEIEYLKDIGGGIKDLKFVGYKNNFESK